MVDADSLARLSLFADLSAAELAMIAHSLDEERYPRGAKALRAGISGANFFVIMDGEAAVNIDGEERSRLHPGEFFGEISVLTGVPTVADVVAASEELRCAILPGPELKPLLLRHPHVAVRMLELGAHRLRAANEWAR
jgi:CRP-like cAMP-binding protein